ncbi:MAG: zinc ribbon domain-containing protein, partial [Clostridia bacterium]|nr:zinc ribbon domain-containing protein [Clostridia bacterium]
ELFNIVREKTQANAYGKHDNRFVYLLKNKVVCGYCGSSVVASTGTSGSGVVNRYYKCRRRVQNKNNCNQNSIRKDDLEEMVIQVMNKALTNNNIITIANEVTTRIRNTNEGQVVLKLLEKDRNKVQREIDNMLKLMGQGICTKSTKQRLIELENQIDTLNDKIIEEKAKEKMQLTDDEIIAFVKKALKKAPRLLLQTLIKKVVLYEDKIEIYFNYTDRTIDEPDDSQDFLFYQEEQAREVHIVRYPKATTDIKKWQVYCLV